MYGYTEAMEAAGAVVLAAEAFGSYQGDWWAKVQFEGRTFWVHGAYGSCSGCDSFHAEFDFDGDDEGCEDHRYDKQADCKACADRSASYQKRFVEFGLSYLTRNDMTQEEAEKAAAENLDWDSDAQAMVDFVKANAL